jgi:hypothetical protein
MRKPQNTVKLIVDEKSDSQILTETNTADNNSREVHFVFLDLRCQIGKKR